MVSVFKINNLRIKFSLLIFLTNLMINFKASKIYSGFWSNIYFSMNFARWWTQVCPLCPDKFHLHHYPKIIYVHFNIVLKSFVIDEMETLKNIVFEVVYTSITKKKENSKTEGKWSVTEGRRLGTINLKHWIRLC